MTSKAYMINEEVIFDVNDSTLQSLANNEVSVTLNAPTARCLLLLLKSDGKVISREKFLEEVWKKKGVVVSENTFYQNISLLRKSLSKVGLSQEIIVTIRQRGFIIANDTMIEVISQDNEIRPDEMENNQQNSFEVSSPIRNKHFLNEREMIDTKEINSFGIDLIASKISVWTFFIIVIMALVDILSFIFK